MGFWNLENTRSKLDFFYFCEKAQRLNLSFMSKMISFVRLSGIYFLARQVAELFDSLETIIRNPESRAR